MQVEFFVGVEQLSNPNYLIKVSMSYLLHIVMILSGALSAGTDIFIMLCQIDMLSCLHFATPYQWVV